ncbi:MAG TPA: transcription termination/antitermination NusG family protein [Silvibacterium sp.]|nr:transcription termination/antitermination NusG family protein [Silvibacterium sp.]
MSSSVPVAKSSNLWRDTSWFALHTKPRRENFAATNVSTLGIESFLPRIKAERMVHGVTERTIIKPLFPGYFFARFRPEDSLESVERSRGVLHVVSSGRCPIPVGDEIVRDIQNRAGEDGLIRIRQPYFKSGDRISIQGGPFEGMMGIVERELDDGKRVAILLETLWYSRVLIEKRWLDAAAA